MQKYQKIKSKTLLCFICPWMFYLRSWLPCYLWIPFRSSTDVLPCYHVLLTDSHYVFDGFAVDDSIIILIVKYVHYVIASGAKQTGITYCFWWGFLVTFFPREKSNQKILIQFFHFLPFDQDLMQQDQLNHIYHNRSSTERDKRQCKTSRWHDIYIYTYIYECL